MESTQYRIYLYGQENVNQDLIVHEPPAYRSLYITNAAVDDNGHLILTFSDDSTIDSGLVRGPIGATGQKGDQGASVNWRGEWVSGSTYSYLDCVTRNENIYIYISKTASSSGVSDTTKWDLMLRRGAPGVDGTNGIDGVTFTPSVSADGVLSWSNDSGKPNPASVNIRGEPGKGFKIIGYYSTYANLVSSVTNPSAGDAYGIGTSDPYDIYIWDGANNVWVNNGALQGAAGQDGAPGQAGTTFTPSVSSDGVLSWTNDGGKANPASVNIKGQTGAPGIDGFDGVTFTPSVSSDGVLSWTNDGTRPNPASVNLRGPAGAAGKDPEPFYVNCTIPEYNEISNEITHDKTYEEILAAWQAGRPCYALLEKAGVTTTDSNILPLVKVYPESEYVEFSKACADAPDTPNMLAVCDIMISAGGGAEGIWTTCLTASSYKEFLPSVTTSDNGKFLRVVNGAWVKASISNANGGSF